MFNNFILFILLVYSDQLISQNLICNGDFEENIDTFYGGRTNRLKDSIFAINKLTKCWNELYGYPTYINHRLRFPSGNIAFTFSHTNAFRNQSFVGMTSEYTLIDTINKILLIDTITNGYIYNHLTQALDYTDGIRQVLTSPIKKDSTYIISYRYKNGFIAKTLDTNYSYINNNPFYKNLIANFGVLFSNSNLYSTIQNPIDYFKPYLQDTILDTSYNWRLIKFEFISDSNYSQINFANFINSKNKKYIIKCFEYYPTYNFSLSQFIFLLDDVRLLPKYQYLGVTPDVYACEGDSLELKVISGAGGYKWAESNNQTTILSTQSTLKIKLADTNITYQVMSPYDTALIPIYVSKNTSTFDTTNYSTCQNQTLKISVPNIKVWYDNSKDTTKTFTQSGNYWYQAKSQCDIKRTQLNISINNSKYDTIKQISCDSFSYKNTNYKNSGFYTYPYKTIYNCDSIQTLNLIINQSKNSLINQFSCTPYFWIDSTYKQTGTYTKKLKTINQCDSIVSLNLNIGLNNKINLTSGTNYTSQQDSVSYQWYRCNPWRRITNETKRTFTTTTKGSYAVVLDNGKGCKDTSDCIALYSSGFATTIDAITRIYPNPFITNLTVELDKFYKKINIKIYNLTGRLILNNDYQNNSTFIILNSTLSKGTYYLQIETENTIQFFNILKD